MGGICSPGVRLWSVRCSCWWRTVGQAIAAREQWLAARQPLAWAGEAAICERSLPGRLAPDVLAVITRYRALACRYTRPASAKMTRPPEGRMTCLRALRGPPAAQAFS
jgi:hypothetical protein